MGSYTYLTPTLQLASDIISNPWFVLIGVGVIGVFMFVFMFMMVPQMMSQPNKR